MPKSLIGAAGSEYMAKPMSMSSMLGWGRKQRSLIVRAAFFRLDRLDRLVWQQRRQWGGCGHTLYGQADQKLLCFGSSPVLPTARPSTAGGRSWCAGEGSRKGYTFLFNNVRTKSVAPASHLTGAVPSSYWRSTSWCFSLIFSFTAEQ